MHQLSDEQIEDIADRAAKKAANAAVEQALQTMYAEVGKSVLKKGIVVLGIAIVALLMWLQGHGFK